MSGKNINFEDKKSKKWFLQKQESIQDRWNWCNKILVSKIEPLVELIQLNISLDIMMMMLLDHYV